jgi:hypothetical protein
MATAGAAIASLRSAVDAITAAAAAWPIAAVMRAAAARFAVAERAALRLTTMQRLPMPAGHVPPQAMRRRLVTMAVVDHTQRQRVAAAVAVAADMQVVAAAADMQVVAAADTGNL